MSKWKDLKESLYFIYDRSTTEILIELSAYYELRIKLKGHFKLTPSEKWNYDLIQLICSLFDDYSIYEVDTYTA